MIWLAWLAAAELPPLASHDSWSCPTSSDWAVIHRELSPLIASQIHASPMKGLNSSNSNSWKNRSPTTIQRRESNRKTIENKIKEQEPSNCSLACTYVYQWWTGSAVFGYLCRPPEASRITKAHITNLGLAADGDIHRRPQVGNVLHANASQLVIHTATEYILCISMHICAYCTCFAIAIIR